MLRDTADVARRIFRRGLANAQVEIRIGDNELCVSTDRDGYFDVHLPISHTLPIDVSWHRADILVHRADQTTVRTHVEVYVPPPEADLLVISDIDDTVMFTGVAEKLKMLYRLFVKNPTAAPPSPELHRFIRRCTEALVSVPNGLFYMSPGARGRFTKCSKRFFRSTVFPLGRYFSYVNGASPGVAPGHGGLKSISVI